ncbi:hypothetical protein ZTR_01648 [Talaromyces verruculosus]|nr:hypothetical protein ZTR_01648 [Talaromyces verruculosus]
MEAAAMSSESHETNIELHQLNNDHHNSQQHPENNTISRQSTMNTVSPSQPVPEPSPTLKTSRVAVIMLSLSASVFVSALDITIISTASPAIASHFRSASGYTWIGSAYTLANTSTMPTWGKISDIWGLANSIGLLLAGRAIQGVGSAGLNILVNICVSDLFALRDRGLYFGLLSVVWAIASGVGPVLGGVFSEKLSLEDVYPAVEVSPLTMAVPIIGAVFVLLWFALKLNTPRTPVWEGLKAVDWTGGSLVIGSTLMLLLGLDFGGVTRPWSSATVVFLLVFSVVVGALFVVNEKKIARYPVISGTGIGLNFEAPLLSLQAIVGNRNATAATSTIGFVRTIACAISLVLGSVVFQNQMVKQGPTLTAALGPSLGAFLSGGDAAANIGVVNSLPPAQQAVARHALHHALMSMWIMYVGLAGVGLVGGCLMSSHLLSREHEAVVLGLEHDSGRHGDDNDI